MLSSIDRILEYTEHHDYATFKEDYKTVDAVIRNFEIIGEAAKHVPDEVRIQNPEVPWEEMYLMRNKVSHEYFGIDYAIIWDVIDNHLPHNRIQIEIIIEELES